MKILVDAQEVVETLQEVVTLKTLWIDFFRRPKAARTRKRQDELREREEKLLKRCQRHINDYNKLTGGDGL